MNRDMFSLRYGQTGRMEFRIVTETGTAPELRGALMVDGRAVRLVPSGAAALLVPVVPPGVYLMEVRCGGATVLYSELEVKPSPLPLGDEAGVVQWTVNADLTQALAVVEVHLHEGPQGERGAPLTYADLTEEQKEELAKTAREAVEDHAGDTTAHVTAEERAAWNGKLTPEALTEERETEVELSVPDGEKYFCLGRYAVIDGARVPGGELLRFLCGFVPFSETSATLVLEQRESEGAEWREVGSSKVILERVPFAGITNANGAPIWEFKGCKLTAGQDLRMRYLTTDAFIYAHLLPEEGYYVDNASEGEMHGFLVPTRFYLTQNVSKYATTGDLDKHTADTVAHLTAEEREAWTEGVPQPYAPALPEVLRSHAVYDLGELTGAVDLTGLTFEADDTVVQTCELWFITGIDSVPEVSWPMAAIWPDEVGQTAPVGLNTGTAYRFALRREPGGNFIITHAYEYSL